MQNLKFSVGFISELRKTPSSNFTNNSNDAEGSQAEERQ
jgi:hypothetical protein